MTFFNHMFNQIKVNQTGFGFFATVTGFFCDGALLGGFFATVNSRGFFATVLRGFLRRLEGFFATVK